MARTIWLAFQDSKLAITTVTKTPIIDGSSYFEDGEDPEYTILRVVGSYQWWVGTGIATDGSAHMAFYVANDDQDAAETAPLNLTAGNTAVFDDQAFWMWKDSTTYDADFVEDYHYRQEVDITTRRVVRRGEDFLWQLVADAVTAGTVRLSMAIRILILVD